MNDLLTYNIVVRIDSLLKLRDETRKDLAALIGKNPQVFTDWKNQGASPSAIDIWKIATHLGTTVEYIMTGSDERMPEDIKKAVIKLSSLTEEQRRPIMSIIDGQVDYWKKAFSEK